MCPPTDTNTETMSPETILLVLLESSGALYALGYPGTAANLRSVRTNVAALIASNAELERLCDATYVAQGADAYHHACETMEAWQRVRAESGKDPGCGGSLCDGLSWLHSRVDSLEAERDSADRYGWVDGPPPYPYGEDWFLADTGRGAVILRSLPKDNAYDYTTADHTYIAKANVKRWMQLPESKFIAYLSSGQILELRAERDSLIAEREALRSALVALRDAGPNGATAFAGWHPAYADATRLALDALAIGEARKPEGGAP